MVKLTLYGIDCSPPVRACLLTLKALNLPFQNNRINLANGENLSEEYLKKNPQHTVPTLEDDGHFICDSHAIMAYLVSKYGKEDSLYPKDLLQRAAVDQRLYFEASVLFQGGIHSIVTPMLTKKETQVPQHKLDAVIVGYNFLETFLQDKIYMAGQQLTIADFSIISTVSSLVIFVEIDAGKYPKLTAWIKRMETSLPYYQEANGAGVQLLKEMIKATNFTIVP